MDVGHLSGATCCSCQQRHLGMSHGVLQRRCRCKHMYIHTYTHVYFLKSEPKYFIVAAGEFSAPGTGQALIAVNLKET